MKTLTVLNMKHPYNAYRASRLALKQRLDPMSNAELTAILRQNGLLLIGAIDRKTMIRTILIGFDDQFKKAWKDKHGFPFDAVSRPYYLVARYGVVIAWRWLKRWINRTRN